MKSSEHNISKNEKTFLEYLGNRTAFLSKLTILLSLTPWLVSVLFENIFLLFFWTSTVVILSATTSAIILVKAVRYFRLKKANNS
ncbi:MAG: hypothetical protein FWG63_01685 [Defluviitaleaceae bacterium]|nr:hypothetical protein [Defluviitaleaceae bacterium]